MESRHGYYKGVLERDGFKTPFMVYASSDEHAAEKALRTALFGMNDATISELEGPYQNIQL